MLSIVELNQSFTMGYLANLLANRGPAMRSRHLPASRQAANRDLSQVAVESKRTSNTESL
jgi:hypothetical protein